MDNSPGAHGPPPLTGLIGGAALACIALGALVLAGWTLDIVALKSVWPGFVSMKANTALEFILCGGALWELRIPSSDARDGARRAAQVAAAAAFAFAALTLGEHFFSWNAGIDQLLFHERTAASGTLAPGRMAPLSALSFVAVGVALFLLLRSSPERYPRRARPFVEGTAGATSFLGLTALGGHATHASMLFGWGRFTEGSILASAGFVLLGTGLFAVAWRERRLRWAIGNWPTAAFLGGLGAFVVLVGVAQTSIEHMRQDAQLVAQAHEVRFRIGALLDAVGDMETASRDYAVTGDESHAATYHAAVRDLSGAMDTLRRVTAGDPEQRRLLEARAPIIAARVDDVRDGVERHRAAREAAALTVARSGRVKADMDSLRRVIDRLDREVSRLAQTRQAASDLTTRGMFLAVQLGGVVSLLLLAVVMLRTNNEIVAGESAAAAMRESEEKFRAVFELSAVGLALVAPDLRYLRVNDKFCEITSYRREELEGKTLELVTHPDDRATDLQLAAELRTGERESYAREKRYVRKDGTIAWVAASVSFVRPTTGEAGYFIGAVNDITERIDAERARRESEERLRLATEEGGVAVWEYDFNTDTMERSGNHDALYGLERQETWRLDTFLNATHPDDRELSNSAIQSSVSPGGSDDYQFDFRVVHPDGSIHWLAVVGHVAERDARGQGTVVRGFLIDITDRKLADEQLRRTATDLRLQGAALSAAANAIMITDRDGTIEWVNPAFTAMTGYGADEAIGRNPRDIVKSGAHDRSFYDAMWRTLLTEGVWRGEITNRRKDGTLYPELMTMTPVRDANDDITNFIAIKEDLTERRRLEATLAQSQRLETVGSLAGGVAHDFNNLLTVISGAAELAALDAPRDSRLLEATATIRSAADRAAALTRQLLAFSRKQFLQPVVVELNAVVKNFQPMVRRLIREDIEIHVALFGDAGNVRVDVAQIDQVLLNLVVNSRDAMPNGGTLTIETGGVVLDASDARIHPGMAPGPHAMLAVTDTGSGMDEATRQRMFDPFFTTKERGKGTGLGMATVYGIVKQSGGSIWAYSEVGRGTTIKVYFPRVAEAAAAVTVAKVAERARGTETILVVDDDTAVRGMAARILETSGYQTRAVPSGAAAVKLLEDAAAPVHLLMTDLVMPGMSGLELAKRAKSLRPEVKILVTSGYLPDGAELSDAIAVGVHFISKPYSLSELTNKVREVLDAPPTV